MRDRLFGRGRERSVTDRTVLVLHDVTKTYPNGKTALLEYALDTAKDFRVVRTSGVEGETELDYAALQQLWLADPGYVAPPPEVAEFLKRRFLSGSPAMLQGMADALRQEPDRVAELAATDVPVLVAHGVDDDAWPPSVQREMAGRLGAHYAVIPGAVH